MSEVEVANAVNETSGAQESEVPSRVALIGESANLSLVAALLSQLTSIEKGLDIQIASDELYAAAQKLTDLQAPGREVRNVLVDFKDSGYDLNELVEEALNARGQETQEEQLGSKLTGVSLAVPQADGDASDVNSAILPEPKTTYGIKQVYTGCGTSLSGVISDTYDNVGDAIAELNRLTEEVGGKYILSEFVSAAA